MTERTDFEKVSSVAENRLTLSGEFPQVEMSTSFNKGEEGHVDQSQIWGNARLATHCTFDKDQMLARISVAKSLKGETKGSWETIGVRQYERRPEGDKFELVWEKNTGDLKKWGDEQSKAILASQPK